VKKPLIFLCILYITREIGPVVMNFHEKRKKFEALSSNPSTLPKRKKEINYSKWIKCLNVRPKSTSEKSFKILENIVLSKVSQAQRPKIICSPSHADYRPKTIEVIYWTWVIH
jgi:hypothetical protein